MQDDTANRPLPSSKGETLVSNPTNHPVMGIRTSPNTTIETITSPLVRRLFIPLLVAVVGAVAAWAQTKVVPQRATVLMTPVSKDSITIAGEPELYLSTPEPEVSSVLFTFPPGAESQWMIHPAPAYIYVLEGTLLVEFEDGSHQSFRAGQGFLQCRSKWHRGRNDGSQTMRFLAVFFGAKGVPDVVHPASGPVADQQK